MSEMTEAEKAVVPFARFVALVCGKLPRDVVQQCLDDARHYGQGDPDSYSTQVATELAADGFYLSAREYLSIRTGLLEKEYEEKRRELRKALVVVSGLEDLKDKLSVVLAHLELVQPTEQKPGDERF